MTTRPTAEAPAGSALSTPSGAAPDGLSPPPAAGAAVPSAGRPGRRGTADPVKALMHRHRELCERAVDALEIAAGLEAHGLTDRTAARFRHRDVFSLAEELYARVPRAETHAGVAPGAQTAREATAEAEPRARRVLYLLPGAGCLAAVAGIRLAGEAAAGPAVPLGIGAAGAVAVGAGLRLCLRRGSLAVRGRAAGGGALLWTGLLLGHLLFGDALLSWAATGGQGGPWPPVIGSAEAMAALALAVAFAVGPAAWCARWFAVRARRRLAASRGPEEFAAGVRPLLPAAVGLFLGAWVALLLAAREALAASSSYRAGELASAAALGVLLFVARLLAVHGQSGAAAGGLAAVCGVEVAALATTLAARLPGCGGLGGPVEAVVTAYGPAAVPLAACAVAAICLLIHATVTLARASAHSDIPAVSR
ncbi:hypothetical protein ABZW18_16870 [Streptomyces sp. NPDC004647]|uniref:hypothetical protein n=1 Tax=Streptomyces sp. NPDC004647 TaxID=3154671 RepID=UPI0033AA3501